MSYHNNLLSTIHNLGFLRFFRTNFPERRCFNGCDFDQTDRGVAENENDYTVTLDVPGVSKENLNISLKDEVLSVSTHFEQKDKDNKEQREYNFILQVPRDVDSENIDVVLNRGVLTVTLPKSEKAKPILIDVKEVA